jgi:hypothetical protein
VTDPAPHAEHADRELLENVPARHAVHAVAPGADSVLVVEPAVHGWHTADDVAAGVVENRPAAQPIHWMVGPEEKLPAAQAVHDDAPNFASVLVTDPAVHRRQATVGLAEKVPAAQTRHSEAPGCERVSVMAPAGQRAHGDPGPGECHPGLHGGPDCCCAPIGWPSSSEHRAGAMHRKGLHCVSPGRHIIARLRGSRSRRRRPGPRHKPAVRHYSSCAYSLWLVIDGLPMGKVPGVVILLPCLLH